MKEARPLPEIIPAETFDFPFGDISACAFSENLRWVAMGRMFTVVRARISHRPLPHAIGYHGPLDSRDWAAVAVEEFEWEDRAVRHWSDGGSCPSERPFTYGIRSLSYGSPPGFVTTTGADGVVRLLPIVKCGKPMALIPKEDTGGAYAALIPGGHQSAFVAYHDGSIRRWAINTGKSDTIANNLSGPVLALAASKDGRMLISGGAERVIRIWDVADKRCAHALEGHRGQIAVMDLDSTGDLLASGSSDGTVRIWNVRTGKAVRVLTDNTVGICCLAWHPRAALLLCGSSNGGLYIFDLRAGAKQVRLNAHNCGLIGVAWRRNGRCAISMDKAGRICRWHIPTMIVEDESAQVAVDSGLEESRYTNAKVLIVGEPGSGKSGLAQVLAGETWKPTPSTVGAWAKQWAIPLEAENGIEREIWFWDFGGQADQRLIHQLYMDDAALAIHVFDAQASNIIDSLREWDRDISRASRPVITKLLVAGRIDAGPLRISRKRVLEFAESYGYRHYLETSALEGTNCARLRELMVSEIRWEYITSHSSPLVFKELRSDVIQLKKGARALFRFVELREAVQARRARSTLDFSAEDLQTVVKLLSGPGVVRELSFGSWVLLQPERLNLYAQAVIQTMREDPLERGCIEERLVLNGELTFRKIPRLAWDEERILLLAMHQMLIARELCVRQYSDDGKTMLLVFPSYYRRDRPEMPDARRVFVSYEFDGFVDDIYATLIVRLHHSHFIKPGKLWRYAADFRAENGRELGLKMIPRSGGRGELQLFIDDDVPDSDKIIYSRYINDHLIRSASAIVRCRHYYCAKCGGAVPYSVAKKGLESDKADVPCAYCGERVPLFDRMEKLFADPALTERVRELEIKTKLELDSETKARALVGEVISTVSLAGQIVRDISTSDHGIDMEIEFKGKGGAATGRKLYLQLKAGESHLHQRKDGHEIYYIKKARHCEYWMSQQFPVMLVIRKTPGDPVMWMEIRGYLQERVKVTGKSVSEIEFSGEILDINSILRWRERLLSNGR